MSDLLDRERLTQALALAESSFGLTEPNPRVGCVIGTEAGAVLGRGATQQAGGAHAEVMALRDAQALGHDVAGATAWVTLEPCAHHGRTPPCCDALLAAGLRRVVVGLEDPFPAVDGRGIGRLRAAGVQVDRAPQDLAQACHEINIGFFSRVRRGRPWVRVKVAQTLDGRTALPDGRSQWITGEEARRDGHAWRRRAGAVLTGIGTVLADDPRLDVRLVSTPRQPLRVILDSRWRTPPQARLFEVPGTIVVVGAADGAADPAGQDRRAALLHQGAEPVALPGAHGRVDLPGLLGWLAGRGVNELHVEAGAQLNGRLMQEGLVDELLVYVAPLVLGEGRPLALLDPVAHLSEAKKWQWFEQTRVGADLRLRLRAPQAEGV